MTIKNLYPKSRPQIIYNVINGRPELPATSKFSRASTATYVDAGGIIQTAAVDEPRFNYDPTTGEFLGLLLGKSTENLVQWSSDPQTYSTSNPTPWYPISATFGLSDPMGENNACEITVGQSDFVYWRDIRSAGNVVANKVYWISVFVKSVDGGSDKISLQIDENNFQGRRSYYEYTFSTNKFEEVSSALSLETRVYKFPDGWIRLAINIKPQPNGGTPTKWVLMNRPISPTDPEQKYLFYGWQNEQNEALSPYIPVYDDDTDAAATADDAFSLTTASDFDNGFSLLLDSDTTTKDFLYRIKASGTTIASLANNGGILEWDINGKSAQLNGEYPQVGFVLGRVRTVSSFGPAGQGDQINYLYTTGLSFPTTAEPGSGADELEFGTPQTLKALYLWAGQLGNDEAVSVIKGEYNVVPAEPIISDSYSFVIDSDKKNTGDASVSLPFIVPTVSMRVYWGDGKSSRYEQGVTPSHTYPYPGQYRIQIVADDGFDRVTVGDASANYTGPKDVKRVDQWPPEYRVGATGPGFTGVDLERMFRGLNMDYFPAFKYTDLTDIGYAFSGSYDVTDWDWVPYDLTECTQLISAFSASFRKDPISIANQFPQLITSDKLTAADGLFYNAQLTGFVDQDGNTVLNPFTNGTKIKSYSRTFQTNKLTEIELDMDSCTNLSNAFATSNNWVTMSYLDTTTVTNMRATWEKCNNLETIPLMPTQNVERFDYCWKDCEKLNNFPLLITSSCTNFANAWSGCESLTSFPLIDTSSGANFSNAWIGCNSLTSFPLLDTSSGTSFANAWIGCNSLTSFPLLDTSSGTSFANAWYGCDSLADFPANMFDTTGTLVSNAFTQAWQNCALTAQSIENILVSLDTNGQSNIELGIDGGTNAAKSTWTAAANTAYTNLIAKGWTIEFNA